MQVFTFNDYCKQKFKTKVYKLSLSTGCTCPNRDGTISFGGCTFCSQGGSGEFSQKNDDIKTQIQKARLLVEKKIPSSIPFENRKFIAYFQSFTNTYCKNHEEEIRLIQLFEETISFDEIVALSIGTRPDCISDFMMNELSRLNKIKPVWIELGLQTIHQQTAKNINRGYELSVFEKTYYQLKEKGFYVIVHLILGLPGESQEMILESVDYLNNLNPKLDGIKLQLLHVLKGTELYNQYQKEPFHIYTMEEYCDLVVKCLKHLDKDICVHRMTGDGDKKILVEPVWSGNKRVVLNYLNNLIKNS